jgi:PadR family transcriptional regulator, regulatory protein PadR
VLPPAGSQRGPTEMLVLGVLRARPMYGYEIIRELRSQSEGYFALEEGLLYPTLHRLEREGLVSSEWRTAESGRRRKYYTLTKKGQTALVRAAGEWQTYLQKLLGIVAPLGGASRAGG